MNKNESIKNEKNLDRVVRVHTHEQIKIIFYLNSK